MPELPEVETIKNDLKEELVGLKILDFKSSWPKRVHPSLVELKKKVIGATIKDITRRAKLIIFHLDNGLKTAFHLKISGRLFIRRPKDPADKYTHHVFNLSQQKELRFSDLRKFGYIKLLSPKELAVELSKFGPEPLSSQLDEKIFYDLLRVRNRPIKLVLMDQSVIAGVGNIYACEALFLARIHPEKRANRLSKLQSETLYQKIEQVLKESLTFRGASDNSYLDAHGKKGHYQEHFRVYNRKGEKCPGNCNGSVVYCKLAGRGAYLCPKCQRR